MIDKYEAAELFEVGRAQDVILGVKELYVSDNRLEPPFDYRDTELGLFEE
jgi:hypothetical protein